MGFWLAAASSEIVTKLKYPFFSWCSNKLLSRHEIAAKLEEAAGPDASLIHIDIQPFGQSNRDRPPRGDHGDRSDRSDRGSDRGSDRSSGGWSRGGRTGGGGPGHGNGNGGPGSGGAGGFRGDRDSPRDRRDRDDRRRPF